MAILIVEDNALIAMTLEATLNQAGYTVLGPAPSAARALQVAAETPPRIALLNIHLRGDGDGAGLARALKERWGTTVIFHTGQATDARRHRAFAIGVLAKPCSDEALLAAVRFADGLIRGEPEDRAVLPKGLEIF
jgi:DNA-binding response OmpR family regulator